MFENDNDHDRYSNERVDHQDEYDKMLSRKIKDLYGEFCYVVKRRNGDELNIHDVLLDMFFLGHPKRDRDYQRERRIAPF